MELTERETEIWELIAQDKQSKEIVLELKIAEAMVKNQIVSFSGSSVLGLRQQ